MKITMGIGDGVKQIEKNWIEESRNNSVANNHYSASR